MSSSEAHVVAVLGAGTMGHGIAQVSAQAGFATRLFDVRRDLADAGKNKIAGALSRLVEKQRITEADKGALLERITTFDDVAEAARGATVVIEAAPEQMDLKVELFRKVADVVSSTAILASNTSSLSITELGRRIGSPERVLGLHFFNPPPVMELVEVIRGATTTDESLETSLAFVTALKKTSIVVRDFPGFATSRLGVCIGAEAIRMLEQGVAGVADIDRAMELGYRHPMGPLKLGDLVGLDVRLAILEHLHRELGEVFRPPALLRQLVRAGHLGKKTGRGFYVWGEDGPTPASFR
jgi:3-hydroxybutyryl-CoA dehydrogenase